MVFFWQQPDFFWLAALLPVLVALRWLRVRRAERVAPSVIPFKEMMSADKPVPPRRIVFDLELVAELVFASLVILALAGPALEQTTDPVIRIVALIDNTASASAPVSASNAVTRLDAAKSKTNDAINELIADYKGNRVRIDARFVGIADRTPYETIDSIQIVRGAVEYNPHGALDAGRIALGNREPDVVFYAGARPLTELGVPSQKVKHILVGESLNNTALARASHHLWTPGATQDSTSALFIQAVRFNADASPSVADIRVSPLFDNGTAEELAVTTTIDFPANGRVRDIIIPLPLQYETPAPSRTDCIGWRIEISEPGDSLTIDNVMTLTRANREETRALPLNRLTLGYAFNDETTGVVWRRAFESLGISPVAVTPETLPVWVVASDSFSGKGFIEILVNPATAPDWIARIGATETGGALEPAGIDHPLTAALRRAGTIRVSRFRPLTPASDARVIATIGGQPAIISVRSPQRALPQTVCLFAFDIAESNLADEEAGAFLAVLRTLLLDVNADFDSQPDGTAVSSVSDAACAAFDARVPTTATVDAFQPPAFDSLSGFSMIRRSFRPYLSFGALAACLWLIHLRGRR